MAVTVKAFPGREFAGVVDFVGPTMDAANTAWLPRLTVSGKYTQQSDVTSLGISLPRITSYNVCYTKLLRLGFNAAYQYARGNRAQGESVSIDAPNA